MKHFILLLSTLITVQVSAQFNPGRGTYPLDTVIFIHQNDADFIQIPENSLWHKTRGNKSGMENNDASWVLVSDTGHAFVSQDTSYFDIKIPNALLFGGENSEIYKEALDHNLESLFYSYLWSYSIRIENQFQITDESKGVFLYKDDQSTLFDTVGIWYENSDRYNDCHFQISQTLSPNHPEDFWSKMAYPISGDTEQSWKYTWLYYYFLPASLKSNSINTDNVLEDTTTVRVLYIAPDSLSGGAGWMIKSIAIRTYVCLENCPTEVEQINGTEPIISIYPNPVADFLHLKPGKTAPENLSYKIINAMGQAMNVKSSHNNGEVLFETSQLSKGSYVLLVQGSGFFNSYLFVK